MTIERALMSCGTKLASNNWIQAHPYVVLDDSSTSDGVASTFSAISARYIRLRLYNDGQYGFASFTELYNFKLFSGSINVADSDVAGVKIGVTAANGGNTTDAYYGPLAYSLSMDTSTSWSAVGAIFTGGSATNSIARSSKLNTSASTFTGDGSSSSPFCIVIDLGQTRTFTQARYYQTFSDGKTTHAALDYSLNATLPTRF